MAVTFGDNSGGVEALSAVAPCRYGPQKRARSIKLPLYQGMSLQSVFLRM